MAKKGTKGKPKPEDKFTGDENDFTFVKGSTPRPGKPSSLLDTRVVCCGDNLEPLADVPNSVRRNIA